LEEVAETRRREGRRVAAVAGDITDASVRERLVGSDVQEAPPHAVPAE